jgi:ABC-type transporter Mla subunit MlaD
MNLGDPVTLMGFSVGRITSIEAQPPGSYYRVFIGFEVKRPYYGYIWADSKVKIASADFLGHRGLELTPGVAGRPTAYEKNGRVTEILQKDNVVPLAQASAGPFVEPVENPALSERVEQIVDQVEAVLPSIATNLNAALANVAGLASNAGAFVASAQPVMTNLAVIAANLSNPQGSLGEWLITTNLDARIAALSASLNDSLLNLASITSNLNAQVQSNDRMLTQISSLVVDADNLVQGLKRHWLLRGLFPQKKSTATNAPPAKAQIKSK